MDGANTEDSCDHRTTKDTLKDVALVVLVIFLAFVGRELLCWLLKTNHSFSQAQETRSRIERVEQLLTRNGFR